MAEVSAGLVLALPRGLAGRGDGAGAAEVVGERLGAVQRGEDEEGPGVLVGAGGGEAGEDVVVKRGRHVAMWVDDRAQSACSCPVLVYSESP